MPTGLIQKSRLMLDINQVMEIVSLCRNTIYRMEKAGTFPPSTYISANARRWFDSDIAAWQETVDQRSPTRGRGPGRKRKVA